MFGIDTAVWLMIFSTIVTIALMPKAQSATPVAFEDIDFPQVDEGTAQAVFFGDVTTSDWLVITVGNYRTEGIPLNGGKK